MCITANKRAPSSRGIFSPLRHAVFRRIWTASLLSNLGILVLGVGAAWTMTQISSSQRSAPYMSAANEFHIDPEPIRIRRMLERPSDLCAGKRTHPIDHRRMSHRLRAREAALNQDRT